MNQSITHQMYQTKQTWRIQTTYRNGNTVVKNISEQTANHARNDMAIKANLTQTPAGWTADYPLTPAQYAEISFIRSKELAKS